MESSNTGRLKRKWFYGLGLALIAAIAGASTALIYTHPTAAKAISSEIWAKASKLLAQSTPERLPESQVSPLPSPTPPPITSATAIPPEIAEPFREAWYALATQQPEIARSHLEDVAQQQAVPFLADQLLMMEAQAQEQLDRVPEAQATWTTLIQTFPQSPLVPRALLGLHQLDTLRADYPEHPVTGSVLQALLARQPEDLDVLRQLVQFHSQTPDLQPHVDRWVQEQPETLTSEDWQAVANFYWDNWDYGKASRAYDQAPLTAQNLYRNARSHHLTRELAAAREAYAALIAQFPDSDDTALGRRRYADIADPQTAIAVLKPLAERSHLESAEALKALAQIYANNSSPQSAQAARQALWSRFPQSEAAAEAAWDQASALAQAGNLETAIQVAQQVGSAQQDTEMGSYLLYWSGKWQEQIGDTEGAQQTYTQVIQNYPRTYYAWRSAVQLGWPVGDFKAGRLPVTVDYATPIEPLPGVSETVQALYLMGLPSATWERWLWEYGSQAPYGYGVDISADDLFVMALLRNANGDHLRGINQLYSLKTDSFPGATTLLQRRDYWQSLYPLHFYNGADNQIGGDLSSQQGIAQWAQQYNLNPLMVAALIRQESRFEYDIVSRSGALGLMQVMPATGSWIAGQLGISQYQLTNPADNLRFGSWYLDFTHRSYEDNTLLALASYNAGPGNVAKWLNRYGLSDPDTFVEQIPFAETRGYVKSVFGNYWNYWQLYTQEGATLISQLPLHPVASR